MQREAFRAFLPVFQAYHDSKEQMAFSGATLYVGAAILLAVRSDPWQGKSLPDKILLGILFGLLAFCAFGFVLWQLKLRRIAAIRVTACYNLLCKWLRTETEATELALVPDPHKPRLQKWPDAFIAEMAAVAKEQPVDWIAWALPISAMAISTFGAIWNLSK